jgi:hypothetical protein
MKEALKKLSAGLLTLTVIGGVGGLLTTSLASAQPKPATVVTPAQTTTPAFETVIVYGHRPANYAKLIANRKHAG